MEHRLLKGQTIAVDSTTLEANAAMKWLVWRATNDDWKTYVRRLMKAEGIDDPSDDEVRRFDRTRKKKTSNQEWKSATDPDSRVMKMKEGRTHLACKAEHAVELGSGLIVAPAETLQILAEVERVRAYVAEPKRSSRRKWQDKPAGQQPAVYANRRRIQGERGRRLGRQGSEHAERSFAHTCETGGGRWRASAGWPTCRSRT